MQISNDHSNGIDDFFAAESEGVRIYPGSREGELVVDFIQNHVVHGAIFEPKTYFDFISFGALKFLHGQNESLHEQNAILKERVARLEQTMFGTSSEQLAGSDPNIPELTPTPEPSIADAKVTELQKARRARGGDRKPLPAHLPRERITYELLEHDRICPCCHGAVQAIGEEVTEQLTVIPAQYKVLQHARKKYVCRRCEKFVTAPGPKAIIEKSSYASADFLAHVACSKYQFGLPFYRQEAIFEQSGFPFNRATLANLMIGCADKLVALHATLREELLRQGVIHADETRLQVLKEPGRNAEKQSWLWLYRSWQDHQNESLRGIKVCLAHKGYSQITSSPMSLLTHITAITRQRR